MASCAALLLCTRFEQGATLSLLSRPCAGYTPVSYLWFGFALLMWITLFVFTFQRQASPSHFHCTVLQPDGVPSCQLQLLSCSSTCPHPSLHFQVLGHNSDPRGRMFSAIWIAAPAVASIAWAVLNAPAPGMYLVRCAGAAASCVALPCVAWQPCRGLQTSAQSLVQALVSVRMSDPVHVPTSLLGCHLPACR